MFEVSILGASVVVLGALIALEAFFEWRKGARDRAAGRKRQAPVVNGARKEAA